MDPWNPWDPNSDTYDWTADTLHIEPSAHSHMKTLLTEYFIFFVSY